MSTPHRLTERVSPIKVQPDLSEEHKASILRSVRWAWVEVCRKSPDVVASGNEEAISATLADVLNEQDTDGTRVVPGLAGFETVNRGSKVEGADGHIDYQPDLVFRPWMMPGLVRNRSHWGWFVECKLVLGTRSIKPYCDSGVQRFVDRRYAARMPSGAMFAYVRDGSEPYPALEPVLSGAYGNATVELPNTSTPMQIRSRHERSSTTLVSEPIELTHLWLDAEKLSESRPAPRRGDARREALADGVGSNRRNGRGR